MTVLLVLVAGFLCTCGVYLILGRQLSRVVIGIGLLGHGINIALVLSGGDGGLPPFAGTADPESFSDPLPEALVLTAIVITFGVIAFLLALSYRSWRITGNDEVEDDVEDRRIAREAAEHAVIDDEDVMVDPEHRAAAESSHHRGER